MYNTIKKYYDLGMYDDEDVTVFVRAGWITPEQYKQITGLDYEE